jgi:triacylglycerol esterase/lipase EstA (alpha/beta hydrolase family)
MKTVIFVPGFFLQVSKSLDIKKEFEKMGCKAFLFDAGINVGDIKTTATELNDFIEEVCSKNESENVTLLGYSLGGLISCSYFRDLNGRERTNKIITMATPFAGTSLAYAGAIFKSARQMLPESYFLRNLVRENDFSKNVVSIYAGNDKLIRPVSSCILNGAKNIEIPNVGHLDILQSQKTWDVIRSEI